MSMNSNTVTCPQETHDQCVCAEREIMNTPVELTVEEAEEILDNWPIFK